MREARRIGIACLALATALACASHAPPPPEFEALPKEGAYVIGAGDSLKIDVWQNDKASLASVPVRPDGKISLPLLDDVQAGGLTPMQLRDAIAKRLSEYVPSPSVSVIVNDVRSFKVSVIGEVARPARYELKSRASVLDVLALAGGFNQFANRARLVVLRTDGDKQVRFVQVSMSHAGRTKAADVLTKLPAK